MNLFKNIQKYWFEIFRISSIVFGICFFAFLINSILNSHEQYRVSEQRKIKWFQEHNCVHDGYVGAGSYPRKLYRCGSQLLIWRDIPEE